MITLLIVLVISGVLFFVLPDDTTEAAWFDDGFAYRQLVTFTHNAGISSPRSITFSLDTAELISAGAMQADCDDTRFTDINGKSLRYELTGTCNNAATTYEVEVLSVINGSNPFYVYYGNRTAGSESVDLSGVTQLTPSGGDPAITDRADEEKGPGPLVYLSFNENYGSVAQDSTPSGYDGTLGSSTGGDSAEPAWQNEDMCISGGCLMFDGTDDYVTIDDMTTTLQEFTLEAWVNPAYTNSNNRNTIFSKSSFHATATTDFPLNFFTDGFGTTYYTDIDSGNDYNNDARAEYTFSTGATWRHAVTTYDGATLKLFIDGVKVDETSTSITLSSNSRPYTLGRAALENAGGVGLTHFRGLMDEVKIYGYARSEDQVKASYNQTSGAVLGSTNAKNLDFTNGLVAYWKMDETASDTCPSSYDACDSSGRANHLSGTASMGNSSAVFNKAADFTSAVYNSNTKLQGSAPNSDFDINATTGFTVSVWLKKDTSSAGYEHRVIGNRYSWNSSNGWYLTFPTSESLAFSVNSASSGNTHIYTNSALAVGTWYHVVGKYENGVISTYVNGVKQTSTANVAYTTPSRAITIGGIPDNTLYGFDGQLDEIRVYKRSLSDAEILALYNWAPGPVAHWKLDEGTGTSAYDATGEGNTGTLGGDGVGTDVPEWTRGKFGKALKFDGSDYLTVGNVPQTVNSNKLTISYWANFTQLNTRMAHLSRWDNNSSSGVHNIFGIRSQNTSADEIYVLIGNGNDAGSNYFSSTNADLTTGDWIHLTMVYDGTKSTQADRIKFYKNGKLVSGSIVGTIPASLNTGAGYNVDIGEVFGNNGSSVYLSGYIDDVRLYGYARSPQQIQEDMNAGHPAPGSPIGSASAEWSFDEGYGQTAHDISVNSFNAQLGSTSGSDTDDPTWTNETDCKLNKCLTFDATDDYVVATVPGIIDQTAGSFAISAWVKRNGVMHTSHLLAGKSGYHGGIGLGTTSTSCTLSNTTPTVFSADFGTLTQDSWHHLVCVFDSSLNKLYAYKDGKLMNTTDFSGTVRDYNDNFYIGKSSVATPTNSTIDEVKLYNFTLDASQVSLLYNLGGGVNFSSGVLEASDLSDGAGNPPIAHWSLDEKNGTSANDISGNGNTGTLGGDGLGSDVPSWKGLGDCKKGACLEFDGDDSIVASDSASLEPGSGSWTIESWAKPENVNQSSAIVTKNQPTDPWEMYGMYICGDDSCNTAGKKLVVLYQESVWGNYKHIISTDDVVDGNWHHYSFVADQSNNSVYLYKDGVRLSASVTSNGSWPSIDNTNNLVIGTDNGNNYPFTGLIDDVKIYNYARTATQIAYDYNRGAPVGHWELDECTGTTANDSSGNGYTGTITIGASGTYTSAGNCSSGTSTEAWNAGTTGKYNSSMAFDGTNDYISVANGGGLNNLQTGSIAFWIKWSGTQDLGFGSTINGCAMSRQQNGSFTNQTVGLSTNNPNTAKILWRPYLYNGTAITSATSPLDNQWRHVVITYTSGDHKMYIDGKLDASGTTAGTITNNSSTPLYIGAWAGDGACYSTSLIDDIRIYNYILSANQVQKIYNNGAVYFGP